MTRNRLRTRYLSALALPCALVAGCETADYASASNVRSTESERQRWLAFEDEASTRAWTAFELGPPRLSRDEQARLRRAFAEIPPPGTAATYRPQPAPLGVRLSDLEQGVRATCTETGMAVVRAADTDTGRRYELKTADERRAVLLVWPTDDATVYDARLTIGRAGAYTEREEAFVRELREQMEAYGKKRD